MPVALLPPPAAACRRLVVLNVEGLNRDVREPLVPAFASFFGRAQPRVGRDKVLPFLARLARVRARAWQRREPDGI